MTKAEWPEPGDTRNVEEAFKDKTHASDPCKRVVVPIHPATGPLQRRHAQPRSYEVRVEQPGEEAQQAAVYTHLVLKGKT